jgi:osmotically-inducible protein OsmY
MCFPTNSNHPKEIVMLIRTAIVAVASVVALSALPGCAVTRGQSTVGEYVDDATINASVKTKLIDDKTVDAAAINVDTLQGNVILSGFAKTPTERAQAEALARSVKGVKSVKNSLVVKPAS